MTTTDAARASMLNGQLFRYEENGAPGAIRTPGPQIRSLMLYPAELRAHKKGAVSRPL